MKKLVIFGVGLIGGSLALALKRDPNPPFIVGLGRSAAKLQKALQLGVIDSAETDIKKAAQGADIIVIAAPVAQTELILAQVAPYLEHTTTITDVGSTKNDVITIARNILGEKISQFVPGHPIAGAEKSGVSAAKSDLFDHKNIILTPLKETNPANLESVRQMWLKTLGTVHTMDSAQHDGIFATVSHLPHLLAFALVDFITSKPNAEQLFSFAASGFRDFTRIAGSSPEMWRDISLANKSALLNELSAYQEALSSLTKLLSNQDSAGLQALFERASVARNQWAQSKESELKT